MYFSQSQHNQLTRFQIEGAGFRPQLVCSASVLSSPMAALCLLLVLVASPVLAIGDEDLRGPENGRCETTPSFNLAMVVPEQTGHGRPCTVPVLELQGLGGDKIALALRLDTLDIFAFANGQGRWHTFSSWRHLFPGATVLRFGDDYASSHNDTMVTGLRMSRVSILQATGMAAQYEQAPPGSDDGYLRRALATLRLAIAEAECFEGVREKIRSRLDEQKGKQCVL